MKNGFLDDLPDLDLPNWPRRSINTRYDQFGGYFSKSRTYKIFSPIKKKIKSKLFSWSDNTKQLRDELEIELVKLIEVPGIKKMARTIKGPFTGKICL
jgi:hypothetical protein